MWRCFGVVLCVCIVGFVRVLFRRCFFFFFWFVLLFELCPPLRDGSRSCVLVFFHVTRWCPGWRRNGRRNGRRDGKKQKKKKKKKKKKRSRCEVGQRMMSRARCGGDKGGGHTHARARGVFLSIAPRPDASNPTRKDGKGSERGENSSGGGEEKKTCSSGGEGGGGRKMKKKAVVRRLTTWPSRRVGRLLSRQRRAPSTTALHRRAWSWAHRRGRILVTPRLHDDSAPPPRRRARGPGRAGAGAGAGGGDGPVRGARARAAAAAAAEAAAGQCSLSVLVVVGWLVGWLGWWVGWFGRVAPLPRSHAWLGGVGVASGAVGRDHSHQRAHAAH